jgi:translation initiation factor eIF-2B subunit delta
VVELSLIEAWKEMRKDDPEASFEVVVVDSAPLYEGE